MGEWFGAIEFKINRGGRDLIELEKSKEPLAFKIGTGISSEVTCACHWRAVFSFIQRIVLRMRSKLWR